MSDEYIAKAAGEAQAAHEAGSTKLRLKVVSLERFDNVPGEGDIVGVNLQRAGTTSVVFAMCYNLPVDEFNKAPLKEGDYVIVEISLIARPL